jgi:hypothetical protein
LAPHGSRTSTGGTGGAKPIKSYLLCATVVPGTPRRQQHTAALKSPSAPSWPGCRRASWRCPSPPCRADHNRGARSTASAARQDRSGPALLLGHPHQLAGRPRPRISLSVCRRVFVLGTKCHGHIRLLPARLTTRRVEPDTPLIPQPPTTGAQWDDDEEPTVGFPLPKTKEVRFPLGPVRNRDGREG